VIASLRGRLARKAPGEIVIDVGGVGYRVTIPLTTFYRLGDEGDSLELEIHTHVREDTLALFGFGTRLERRLFERLVAVSGVGPRLAVAILSGMPPEELVPALRARDVARLVSIPGVGRKTAERLVLELHEKVLDLTADAGGPPGAAVPPAGETEGAVSALINLGYPERDARRAVREAAPGPGAAPLEEILREALRRLSGGS